MSRLVACIVVSCCCLGYVLFDVAAPGVAQEKSARKTARREAPAAGAIAIPNCRIKLIDDVQLASERSGILAYVAVEGGTVRAGDVVVQIRDNVVRANLAVAEKQAADDVEVRFARKATELAQLKYLRAAEANQRSLGTVSELELRELRLMAEKSLLQLEQAEQQFLLAGLKRDETRELLGTYRVETPFDAVVLNVYKKAGEVVGEGEPILEVANTDRVRVEGYLPVEEAHRIRKGSPVEVRAQVPHLREGTAESTFSGQIGFVDTKVEPVTKKVRVWAVVENRDELLRDGLIATMHVMPSR